MPIFKFFIVLAFFMIQNNILQINNNKLVDNQTCAGFCWSSTLEMVGILLQELGKIAC